MAIAPLQIPGWQPQRDLDFSPLAQLPQVWRQAQRDALTLANIDRLQTAQELTPAMKEYNMALRQGFKGTFLDYRAALARARAMNPGNAAGTGRSDD